MRYVYVEFWTTIAVTSLPAGWHNVYRDGEESERSEVCPALLLQEHRMTNHAGETPNTVQEGTPYNTRVVFGDYGDGTIEPALNADEYLRTEFRG